MNKLYQDSSGKTCAAKTAYMTTLLVFLLKFLISGTNILGVTFEPMDSGVIAAMAAFIGTLGAVYYGRSKTKAEHVI